MLNLGHKNTNLSIIIYNVNNSEHALPWSYEHFRLKGNKGMYWS